MNILDTNGVTVIERVANVTELMDQLTISSTVLARRAGEVAEASEAGDEERAVALLNAASFAADRVLKLSTLLQDNGHGMLQVVLLDDEGQGVLN